LGLTWLIPKSLRSYNDGMERMMKVLHVNMMY